MRSKKKRYVKQSDIKAKSWDGKLYKVLSKADLSDPFSFWGYHLPGHYAPGEPGFWTRRSVVTRRPEVDEDGERYEVGDYWEGGYRLFTHWERWVVRTDKVFEAESDSIVSFDEHGTVVCERVRLIRKIKEAEVRSAISLRRKYGTGKV